MAQTADSGAAASFAALPGELADLLRGEAVALTHEIVAEIERCLPEFEPLVDGVHRAAVRAAVSRGLHQFIDRIADPARATEHSVSLYRALGRSEYIAGRSLDALQGAFRVAARVSWQFYARLGKRAGLPPDTMYLLAETVFAYVEEAAAHAVSGYTALSAELAGEIERKRRRLLELLVATPPLASPARIAELADKAQWPLPETLTCVALGEPWTTGHLISPAVGVDALMDLDRPDPFLVVPDPDAPGRIGQLLRALGDGRFSIGPTVALHEASLSLYLARQGLDLARRGVIHGNPVRCSEHLTTLLFLQDERIMRLLVERCTAPFAGFTPSHRARLTETLYAWLRSEGRIVETADFLHVHPQTVRYRMRQLQELFGQRLHDADWRFEMETGLRIHLLTDWP